MNMRYISTRGRTPAVPFTESVLMGMARDGGLLIPERIPDVRADLDSWRPLNYCDLAVRILRLFVDIPESDLVQLVRTSYSTFRVPEIAPVVRVGPVYIQELFHGPTLAFKDIALQLLGNMFEYTLSRRDTCLNIVAATSGDTGSAAIYGVRGKQRIHIFVMHPAGRVSPMQERQMTSVLDRNVFNMAVGGTFDDCQRLLKDLFGDLEFRDRYHLGAVNSINWSRILAQVVYYFYGAFRALEMSGASQVQFAVPTGNFGDIFAGYVAVRMGLPISRLILATNENDILARFFNTGLYAKGTVLATLSPSMDIQVASNFERYLYYRLGESGQAVDQLMMTFAGEGQIRMPLNGTGVDPLFKAGSCDRAATLSTIRRFADQYHYVLDPHSAVGVDVGHRLADPEIPVVCLATAHPAKFGEAIREATGRRVSHPLLEGLEHCPVRCERLPVSIEDIKSFIRQRAIGGTGQEAPRG